MWTTTAALSRLQKAFTCYGTSCHDNCITMLQNVVSCCTCYGTSCHVAHATERRVRTTAAQCYGTSCHIVQHFTRFTVAGASPLGLAYCTAHGSPRAHLPSRGHHAPFVPAYELDLRLPVDQQRLFKSAEQADGSSSFAGMQREAGHALPTLSLLECMQVRGGRGRICVCKCLCVCACAPLYDLVSLRVLQTDPQDYILMQLFMAVWQLLNCNQK